MNSTLLPWRSLKTRVTLFTLAIFMVSLWVLAFFASRILREDLRHALGEQQFATVSMFANEVNSDLSERMRALETIAREVSPAILGNPETLQALLEQRPLLELLFNAGIFVAGTDGTAIASLPTSTQRIGVNYRDRDFMAAALKEGKASIGRPVIGRRLKSPIFVMAVPLRDSQGQVTGVLAGVTDLDKPNFLDKITQSQYGKTGGYWLIAPQHKLVVTATDKSYIMQPVPAPGINAIDDQYLQGYEGFGIGVSSRGVLELSAAKGIPLAGWYLAVSLPAQEAFAPIDALLRRLMLGALLITLLAGVLIWSLITRMLRQQFAPMLTASRALVTLAVSDQPVPALSVTSQDEIGDLIGGFNRLLETLGKREKALTESEEKYRSLLNNLSSGVVVHNPDTSILLSNAAATVLLGLTEDQLWGRTAMDPDWCFLQENGTLMPLTDYPVNRVIASGEGLRNQVVGVQRPHHAEPNWVLCNAYPMHDEEGKILQVVVTFTDITERKQAEARLQLSASVFEHAGEGIIITNADGTILDVNEAFTRITGYLPEEALGQNPRFLASGLQDQAFYANLWRVLLAEGQWSGEIWNRRKDGSVFAELLTISAVRDAHGSPRHYVALFSDITAIKEYQNQLEHLANFDALTHLPNRVLLADRLQQAMAQAKRRGQQLAVAFLDLDGFKTINDTHGHEVGDQVLITLAARMKRVLREGDTLARLGGDEFVAVLIDLEDRSASLPMLTRQLTAAAQPVQVEDLSLRLSASLGVTFYPQDHDIDADQLLRQADQAMYQAKVAGKNRYHLFDSEQDRHLRGQYESREHLRLALEHQEFVLYYQPKVNMRTGQVIGAEALIRWRHPEKGLLPPALFLPMIEDHALAVPLGEWVIDTALTQIERWQAMGLEMPVSVNIGARQLQQRDFVERLRAILAAHPRVNPDRLELEVLETHAVEDIAQVSRVIEACAEFGVMFALDDFGTGYSSLTYLKRLHVTQLKIDQSFVRDLLDDPDDLVIVQGVISLAAAFKRQVIAEGVETVPHGTLLLRLGCELAQGYGIARPMTAEELPLWSATWQPDPAWRDGLAPGA